ncbi:MAG: hypothetical protein ACK53Y_02945, partial [bacterium]
LCTAQLCHFANDWALVSQNARKNWDVYTPLSARMRQTVTPWHLLKVSKACLDCSISLASFHWCMVRKINLL